MVLFVLPKFNFDVLAELVKGRHYDPDTGNARDLNPNDMAVTGPLEPAYLALKLLGSTFLTERQEDPDAIDEEAKKVMKLVASGESEVVCKVYVGNAPDAVAFEIKRVFGKDVDELELAPEPNPYIVCVESFKGRANEVKICKHSKNDQGKKSFLRFPAKHLWHFSAEKKKTIVETGEQLRVKWALSHVPGYLGWSTRESWDLKQTPGQERHFKMRELLQSQLDDGRKRESIIDFEFKKEGDKNTYLVKWPNDWSDSEYIFPAGEDITGNTTVTKYNKFLKEFFANMITNINEFSLSNCIRVLIFHHCKVDGFCRNFQESNQFEYIKIIGRFVGYHLNHLMKTYEPRKWCTDDYHAVLGDLDDMLKGLIEECENADDDGGGDMLLDELAFDNEGGDGEEAKPAAGAKRKRASALDESDSEE